ncbi:MAG: anti-sigma factor domain-containing protein, partial [Candidatus Binatia bacterium]
AVVVVLVVSQVNLLAQLNDALRLLERTRKVGEFITSPDVSIIPLWGTGSAPGAHAKLAYDGHTGRVMLLSSRIAAPPEGQAYQLWAISERMEPAGILSPGSAGGTVLADYRPAADRSFVFAVTLEPERGADEPTGEMLLLSGPLGG